MDEEAEQLRQTAEKALLKAIVSSIEDGQVSNVHSLAQAYEIVAADRPVAAAAVPTARRRGRLDVSGVLRGTR